MFINLLKLMLFFYSAFFVLGAVAAPLMAQAHWFVQADQLYDLFSASCQQQATRSFWLSGYPMAVCSRCLGVYLGLSALCLVWVFKSLKPNKMLLGFLFLIPIAEKILEWTLWEGNNVIRFLSGISLGFALLLTFVWIGYVIRRKIHAFQKIVLSGS